MKTVFSQNGADVLMLSWGTLAHAGSIAESLENCKKCMNDLHLPSSRAQLERLPKLVTTRQLQSDKQRSQTKENSMICTWI